MCAYTWGIIYVPTYVTTCIPNREGEVVVRRNPTAHCILSVVSHTGADPDEWSRGYVGHIRIRSLISPMDTDPVSGPGPLGPTLSAVYCRRFVFIGGSRSGVLWTIDSIPLSRFPVRCVPDSHPKVEFPELPRSQ